GEPERLVRIEALSVHLGEFGQRGILNGGACQREDCVSRVLGILVNDAAREFQKRGDVRNWRTAVSGKRWLREVDRLRPERSRLPAELRSHQCGVEAAT